MYPLAGGVFDISNDVRQPVNRPETGQNVDVVIGAANGQADGVQSAKCSAQEGMEITAPRRRDDSLPLPGGEDDVKIESGIGSGHDITRGPADQPSLNRAANHCGAPSGRWASVAFPGLRCGAPSGLGVPACRGTLLVPEEPAQSEREGPRTVAQYGCTCIAP